MAATQTEIRKALAKRLTEYFGDGCQVTAEPMANPTPPNLYVRGGPIEYDGTFGRGHDDHEITLVAQVANLADQGSQRLLDEFMAPEGPRSVKYALDGGEGAALDRTLGGLVNDYRVERCSGPLTYTFDTVTTGTQRPPMLGVEWTVRVMN